MYACVCNAITDSQVLRAAEAGVRTLRGLQARLGVALACGRCASHAHGLLREAGVTQTTAPRCGGRCGTCPNSKEKR
ncbi:MAG: (2Fe-2S)-binding protein [Rhodocyclaceae bacterium]|nr:(2Fe-2S)-binding protein [Rhodocyclaceae bacterium]